MLVRKIMVSVAALTAIAAGGSAFAAVTSPVAQTVNNASFESGVSGGYAYQPTGTGVAFNNGSGIASNGSGFGFTTAPDGNNVAFVQGTGDFSTKFYGDLIKGAIYQLSFSAEGRPGYGDDAINVSIHGNSIFSVMPASGAFTIYTSSFKYYGDNNIDFAGLFSQGPNAGSDASQDFASAIDNVHVSLTASAVPETATWMMMIVGFGAVGAMMRRAHRKSEERFTRKVRSLATS